MLPFAWRNYLPLAAELAGRAGDEAAARTAIGRAYYAVLGEAAALLRTEGIAVSPLRIHTDVWRIYKRSIDPSRQLIAAHLNRLRRPRNAADYDVVFPEDLSAMARDAVERAEIVLRTLDDLRSAPA